MQASEIIDKKLPNVTQGWYRTTMPVADRIIAFFVARWHLSLQLVRYVIAGGTAASTELLFLYVFTHFLGIWYFFSLFLAFAVALLVSFLLQKFWTFADTETDGIHLQASSYLFVSLVNLAVNAMLLYLLVQFAGLWYIYAQIAIDALIAVSSFLIYKFLIFRKRGAV